MLLVENDRNFIIRNCEFVKRGAKLCNKQRTGMFLLYWLDKADGRL